MAESDRKRDTKPSKTIFVVNFDVQRWAVDLWWVMESRCRIKELQTPGLIGSLIWGFSPVVTHLGSFIYFHSSGVTHLSAFLIHRVRERELERHFEYYGRIDRIEIKKNFAFIQV